MHAVRALVCSRRAVRRDPEVAQSNGTPTRRSAHSRGGEDADGGAATALGAQESIPGVTELCNGSPRRHSCVPL